MPFQSYVLFLVTLVNLAFLTLLLSSTVKHLSYKFFIGAIFFNIWWTLGDAFFIGSDNPNLVQVGAKLFFVAPMFTAYCLMVFSLLLRRSKTKKYMLAIFLSALLPIIFGVIVSFNLSFLIDTIKVAPGINDFTVNKTNFLLYISLFTLYFSASYWFIFAQSNRETGLERRQTRDVLYAAIVSSGLAMVTNLALPFNGESSYIWLGPVFTLFYVYIVTMSVIKNSLFEIKLAAARASGYLFSLVVLGAIYGGSVYLIGEFLFSHSEISGTIERLIFIMFAILTAAIFQPLRRFFDRITNFIFYRDAYDTREFLGELNTLLAQATNLDSLLLPSAKVIQTQMKLEYCTFGIKETENVPRRVVGTTKRTYKEEDIAELRQLTASTSLGIINTEQLRAKPNKSADEKSLVRLLRRNDVAVLARLAESSGPNREGEGYLLLGPKKSGNMFTAQDIEVLGIAVNSLVLGIQNALRFEEIEQFNETLQAKIYSATKELKSSNEKLKALDEAKDEFISMASHQLRTPLTSVKGYLSMLAEGDAGKLNPTQKKFVDQSFLSAQRMVYLISDLLNVSRLKTGKFVIERHATYLPDVIEEEIAQLYETAAAKQIKFTYNKPKDFPTLQLDETKVRQVVMNFCDNAIYYTPDGGKVTLDLKDKPGHVEFTVTDTGLGVPKEDQHHLFTKFYRAGNARKVRPDGTGLGLFMAKKVIIAQRGNMIFKSTEGKGSTFGFSFPKNHNLMAAEAPKDN